MDKETLELMKKNDEMLEKILADLKEIREMNEKTAESLKAVYNSLV